MDVFMEHVSVHILDVEIKLNPAPQEAGHMDTVQTKVFFDNQNYKNLKTQILKMLYFFLNLSERRKL